MTLERKHPRTVHKCKTERNVYSWPNIEKQLAKTVAKHCTSAWHKNWPPHASDTVLLVKTLVSPLLLNFMAWMLGFSDDPDDADYIELDDQTTSKIFLCVKIWSIFLIGESTDTQVPSTSNDRSADVWLFWPDI